MKLYQFALSPNCQRVVAVAREAAVPLETVPVDVFKGEARSAEILAKNPNGRVPVLEDGEFVLWESTAMLAYVAAAGGRDDLAPTSPRERAEVDRWLAWHNAHFGPAIIKVAFERVVKKLANRGEPDEARVQQGIEEFAVTAAVLDRCLSGKRYLCGKLTIADFGLAPYVALTDSCGLGLERYPHARRWLDRMLERPSLSSTLAEARAA